MNLNKISAAVKAALKATLSKPGTFATDRGVEIEQRSGYKEILVSFKGLKTLLEQEGETVAAPPVVTPPLEPEVTTEVVVTTAETSTEVVTEPAKTEVSVEDPVVEQKAPEPEVVAPAPAPAPAVKAKPGPKPKAPAAA